MNAQTPVRMWTADKMLDPAREGNRLPPLRMTPPAPVTPRPSWRTLFAWRKA